MSDVWKADFAPAIALIGTHIGDPAGQLGADAIEAGAIRRILEPLEFDCALHYDRDVARAHGFADIPCPYTAMMTFTMPAMWQPGQALFDSNARNAQPLKIALGADLAARLGLPARYTGYFATDFAVEFFGVAVVGDRVGRRGNKLVACEPKETSVGRGAFTSFESELFNQRGDILALMRSSMFIYEPKGARP